MSCQREATLKRFQKILVCESCSALAEKAEQEIIQRIEMSRAHAMNWLETHILKGGLLSGGSGIPEGVPDVPPRSPD